ncbi:MAG: hypothetical protein V4691_09400, partial [Pseudomonadota bacterium]
PAHVSYVQEDDPRVERGSSLAAFYKLGVEKGYALVAATEINAFFVRETLCKQHGIETYLPQDVKDTRYEAAIFHGYDGTVMVAGYRSLLWHGIPFDAEEMQILPKNLRHVPINRDEDYYQELGKLKDKRKAGG